MAGDVAYDRQLDQSEGDTCHHCKGDTWHRLTWQTRGKADRAGTVTGGRHVDESMFDTWQFLFGC